MNTTNRTPQTTMTLFVLCERYMHVTGEFGDWELVEQVAPSTRQDWLASFERFASGEQVSERRVFAASVVVSK